MRLSSSAIISRSDGTDFLFLLRDGIMHWLLPTGTISKTQNSYLTFLICFETREKVDSVESGSVERIS